MEIVTPLPPGPKAVSVRSEVYSLASHINHFSISRLPKFCLF